MASARRKFVIGSRGSQLALYQAEWVKARLSEAHPGLDFPVKVISTSGDVVLDRPLSELGGKGVFTKEIEDALIAREIDLAVHSLKDVPTELPPGLGIAAVTRREDVRDVFIPHPKAAVKTIDALPPGAVIATGSLRRRAQLMSWGKQIEIVDLRGNLATRFTKLEQSSWAGMILAKAGVVRLGLADRIGETIDVERMVPAVGQGALGVEVRSGEPELEALLSVIVSEATTFATAAERAFLARLEGGCKVPIGAYGRIEDGLLHLDGLVASLDGVHVYRGKVTGDPEEAAALGDRLAGTLLDSGAGRALEGIRR
jgi:hydroxymethylbilane synthase